MLRLTHAVTVVGALFISGAALAETATFTLGGDTYVTGEQLNQAFQSSGDTFLAGRTIEAGGAVGGDLHVTGFDLAVSTAAAEDLYAAGLNVLINSTVAHDLTAVGLSLRTATPSITQGNARLFGNSVTIDGPVKGALMVTGRDVILNSVIIGDARIVAQTLSFGPEAQVKGTLTYSATEEITVPERVASRDRVVFQMRSGGDIWAEWDSIKQEMPVFPTFASVLFGSVVTLLFFLALGALMLGFMPKRLSRLRRSIVDAPGQTFMLGVIGLSMMFGMVLIVALTVVGLPFVPIIVLGILVAWVFGYALGAYGVAMRIWSGFGGADDPSTLARLLIFAAAIIIVGLLNFIPFVGWIVNYTLVLLGVGALTRALFQKLIGNPDIALDVDMKPLNE